MGSNPVASGAASGGVAGAVVVLASWALGLLHVAVPGEVAAALMVVVSPLLHAALLRWGIEAPSVAAPVVVKPVEVPHA